MTDAPDEQPARVSERGRSKAYRPLPPETRAAAIARGRAAYDRGDFYLAHEELEPAWMGTADPAERALLSGLIKVAAAGVHAARGNPAGVRTNLAGARERLLAASGSAPGMRVDLALLRERVEQTPAALDGALPSPPPANVAAPPHDVAGPPQARRRPPLDLPPIVIPWETA